MKISNWFVVSFVILVLTLVAVYPIRLNKNDAIDIKAETSGSSPESGATSKLKEAYDFLISKGTNYGDSQPSDWIYPSYGTYWNRILYAASWEPDGTATEADVVEGKTFYSGSNNRVQKTGTAQAATHPSAYYEQFVQYDDAHASDYTGEESTWTRTNSAAGEEVWYDTRTQLYWARSEPATLTNSFYISEEDCPFFFPENENSYESYDGSMQDCGEAINACAVLSLATHTGQTAKTDWYLPSQKELIGASIDGIYNKTSTSFTTTASYWSSTEYSGSSTNALYVIRYRGYVGYADRSSTLINVACVRRD